MQKAKRFAIIAGVVVAIILVGGVTLAIIFGKLLELLYVVLIILALLLIAGTVYQIYSVFKLVRAINTVRDEMKPLIGSVNETIGIVKDTAKTAGNTVTTIGTATKFTSELALGPSVRAVAAVVAAQEMGRVFLGKGHARSRAEERRRQQMEAMAAANAAVDRGGE
ncbi:hypothetical protein [Dictyobacter kobayashii]|uniref:DUF948 domain-containing protein n=1 Tax=Dictyobacter kobayashii TaxID=2014872 RepID=A0A402AKF2_9CHLR|nr:hypothetical protein [Dictyobacter kobayashii]GCE19592.1 hypothetical protein KDK_33920 [Dictyobacter kobayashii]